MSRSAAFRNFVVGLVFLGSLLAVGVVTLKVTGLSLAATPTLIRVRFDQISGLRRGDDVRYRGLGIGQVDRIEAAFDQAALDQDRPIEVLVRIQQAPPLTKDTQFLVKSLGPLGGNYLDVIPGTQDIQDPSQPFDGTAVPEMFEELGSIVSENRAALNEAIVQIRDAVKAINEREGALGAFIKDPELRDQIKRAVENIEEITRALKDGEGTLGALVMDSELRDQVKRAVEDIESVTKAISEGDGTLGKLVRESKIHDDLEDLVTSARQIVGDIEEGKGTLGVLIQDDDLAKDLQDGVADIREAVAKINQGEGTLGQLINNREAWDRLVFVLRQMQEAVEDFREQAPISTFLNAIFVGI